MNRDTRDKFASGTKQDDLTTGNACWETAPLVYRKINDDFGPFDIDICADAQRALCSRWFGPGSDLSTDALAADWSAHGFNGYCNPPYGAFIAKILPHAKRQAALGFSSTFLIPLRVTKAFKAHILDGASELLFCDNRLVFFEDGVPRYSRNKNTGQMNTQPDTAMFDSIIVRYLPGVVTSPRMGLWKVPPHVTAADRERALERFREAA